MKRHLFLLLSLLPVTLLIIACARQQAAEPTTTATTSAAATTPYPTIVPASATTVAPPTTVSPPTPPGPASAAAVAALLSGPTPTAVPLPTRSTEVVVVTTRVVEEVEPSPESSSFESNTLAVPADEEQVGASEHFTFYAEAGAGAPLEDLGDRAEETLEYVSRRLGAAYVGAIDQSIDGSIDVLFRAPPETTCPPRGMAFSEPPGELQHAPIIYIFADDETPRNQVLGVLAHEVAHVLHARALEQGLSPSHALNEGFAHWLSADYVYAWYGTSSYDALVRGYVDAGNYLPLYEHYELDAVYPGAEVNDGDCLQLRDQLYTEWASFVGFLIESYGMEPFLELMDSLTRERSAEEVTIFPPDYQSVYGMALNQLEVAWLRRLLRE